MRKSPYASSRGLTAVSGLLAALLVATTLGCGTPAPSPAPGADQAPDADPLPSWNAGPTRDAIIAFVDRVTRAGSDDFVAMADRIAVFDNDGTLWAEQPVYFQVEFAIARVHELAPDHPEWQDTEPFRSVLANDLEGVLAQGGEAISQLLTATHSGMTPAQFQTEVRAWLASARHPTTGMAYTSMVYQPMLELLAYLRANGFKTFIVSGGGLDFMRVFTEPVYGIPTDQVVGTSIKTEFQMIDETPVLMREPAIDFFDDGPGKPVAINRFIGRRPIAAFGNSDGDLQMLQWTCAGDGARYCLIVHHTDAEREWAYDRDSHVGRLDEALQQARAKGWTVVDMKNDWEVIYPR
jgi:hypothetical protein